MPEGQVSEIATLIAEMRMAWKTIDQYNQDLKKLLYTTEDRHTTHLKCPFNPETNGTAEKITREIEEIKKKMLEDSAFKNGMWFGLSGLGMLQMVTFLWPKIFGG